MADPRAGKPTYRTAATQAAYKAYIEAGELHNGCPLCRKTGSKILKEFTHWRIVSNDFPYDSITDTHHMLITTEHKTEAELSDEQLTELYELKQGYLNDRYTFIAEALPGNKSIPPHHHLHLIVVKNL